MNRKAALEAVAVEALTSLIAHEIRTAHGYDPDHSGPEDEAASITARLYAAALTLLAILDHRGDLPRVLLTQAVAGDC